METLPEEIKTLRRIKEKLDQLMSDRGTPVEIRSNALYEYIIRDRELKMLFPHQKIFNQFLRKEQDSGILKQIIPNFRVDTSKHNFYQWYFNRDTSKNVGQGREVETVNSKLTYKKAGLKVICSDETKLRSGQEKEIYEKLLKCNYLTIEYEARISELGENKFVDFKILNRLTQKTYLWEHFGMTNSPEYSDSMVEKIKWYSDNSYQEVRNGGVMIFTIYYGLKEFHTDIDNYINIIIK